MIIYSIRLEKILLIRAQKRHGTPDLYQNKFSVAAVILNPISIIPNEEVQANNFISEMFQNAP